MIPINRDLLAKRRKILQLRKQSDFRCPVLDRPIFIVSAPRAGSTLLFETMSNIQDIWTIGEESHEIFEGIHELHPSFKNFSSNRLTESDATEHITSLLRERFARQLRKKNGQLYIEFQKNGHPDSVRFLEKTPKNALRIPFIKAVFPDALFIFLYREAKQNISSIMEGWKSRRFIAYRKTPGWPEWSFLLVPGWSDMKQSSLAEIAAYQWKISNSYILDDLQALPKSSWHVVRYDELIHEPKKTLKNISEFAALQWDSYIEEAVSHDLPYSSQTLSVPSPDKWRKHEKVILEVIPSLENLIEKFEKLENTNNN